MVCQACGKDVEGEARFCPHCGAQMKAPAMPPPTYSNYGAANGYGVQASGPRVQRHLQTLGTLWCAYGAYRLVTGLIGLFFVRAFAWHRFGYDWPFGAWGMHHGHPWPWMGFVPAILGVAVVMSALALFAGLSLLNRKPYGRVLAIVLAVMALFKFPLGTALGIYTLWVLAPATSALEYESMAERA